MDLSSDEEVIINASQPPVVNDLFSSTSSSSSSSMSDNYDSSDSLDESDNGMSVDSSSEESEDGEHVGMFGAYEELLFGAPKARVENFLEVTRQKSDEEFRQDFRLCREVAYELIGSLDASGFIPNHPEGKEKKSSELSFLVFLWFVGNDPVHRDIANLFGCGISTIFRIVRRVSSWLLRVMPEHIIWPTGDHIGKISDAFAEKANVQKCIGAIDGSHIFIEKPFQYGRVYYSRKQRYSVILQAVTDCKMLFTSVHCGDPGSYHDTRVLRRSELYNLAENRLEDVFPNSTFVMGDKGYYGVGKKWIVTPFKDYGNLTAEQSDFNVRVSSTRVVVEQAFGILKRRFRYIGSTIRLRDLQFIANLVVSCCVLHNICIRSGDTGDDFVEDEIDNNEAGIDEGNEPNIEEDERVDEDDHRMIKLFREMYPGAMIPQNRRAAGEDE